MGKAKTEPKVAANLSVTKDFRERLDTQCTLRNLSQGQVVENDLIELWSLIKKQQEDINDKLDSIKTIVLRIDKNTKQI